MCFTEFCSVICMFDEFAPLHIRREPHIYGSGFFLENIDYANLYVKTQKNGEWESYEGLHSII